MTINDKAPMSYNDRADQDKGASKNLQSYNSIPASNNQCVIKLGRIIARLDAMIEEHIRREEASS